MVLVKPDEGILAFHLYFLFIYLFFLKDTKMSERHLAAAQKMDVLDAQLHSNTKRSLVQKKKKKERRSVILHAAK